MKRLSFVFTIFFIMSVMVVSCDSTWSITGNSLVIHPVQNDTLVRRGTLIINPAKIIQSEFATNSSEK